MNEIQFLMYEADEKIEVVVKDETVWATQKAIADLFGVDRTTISRHLNSYLGISCLIDTILLLFGLPREGLATEELSARTASVK